MYWNSAVVVSNFRIIKMCPICNHRTIQSCLTSQASPVSSRQRELTLILLYHLQIKIFEPCKITHFLARVQYSWHSLFRILLGYICKQITFQAPPFISIVCDQLEGTVTNREVELRIANDRLGMLK